ncbi:adenylate/guanylate cyclase domain-containing protein [Bradyrhizobium sp.]|uniref:adenylate/guanylate cyclase domain-containing protein n=1 Tax=Bradyrhizobium sp. TaxID=376 RepID=UPI0027354E4A|nr:adenylate/guanylate cyclase domain-containing protein [Bradyrhizobium sp.]MDP3693530.1 adenylate/guanylate cyclase domain-containing protein [Bradyrhizobium sp.]
MTGERLQRRLAAVLATDVAGYDGLMAADDEGTLARLKELKKAVVEPAMSAHRSRTVKTSGDRLLVEFASAIDAARCAVDIQRATTGQNAAVPQDQRIEFRIGIHVGDIIFEEDDIFGDGVNIAVRLQSIAEPGGICMSESACREIRGKLEIGYDDLGPQLLKNIAEPVRAWRVHLDAQTAARRAAAPALPDKPSIAVLPFQNIGGDPEQEYFADGLVEDITTALSRFKSLFVIARNSSFSYKGKAIDIGQVGRELGVRYVLEGSVRKAGTTLRIAGQLIEAETGSHLWAGKFDGPMDDVFELQDKVAASVAGVIDPLLLDTEIMRALKRPTADLTSYDLYLRALPLIRAWAREPIARAIVLLEQAIARDPKYGPALASLALCHSQNFLSGWGDAAVESEQGRILAWRAREAAPDDPMSMTSAAGALLNLGEDANLLKPWVDGALARNPSHAFGWLWSGWIRTVAGEADVAIEHFEMSLRLDPRTSRRAFHLTGIGICHFWQRRFERAAVALEASFHELPSYAMTMWFLAACYAHMGRLVYARGFAARNGIVPGGQWLKIGLLYGDPVQRELLLSGLRLATTEQA